MDDVSESAKPNGAAEPPDGFDAEALIAGAFTDPGLPFDRRMLRSLAQLKADNPGAFERLRARLPGSVRLGALDRAIGTVFKDHATKSAKGFAFPETEPWPETIPGDALLDAITSALTAHLVLPNLAAETMALWSVFAHAHDLFDVSPRLGLTSPERRCGKTTSLMALQHLVPKPLPTSNITAAALFRTIEDASPTLLIDEADTFLRQSDELRGILNSGHIKSFAYVIRTTGEQHEPKRFRTWAPIVIAMIGELPSTLRDRTIVIPLRRKKADDDVLPLRADRAGPFTGLARQAARFVADNRQALETWDGGMPRGLHDRAADNWRPLFAIAHAAGGAWPGIAEAAALSLNADEDDTSIGAMLLQDLHDLFAARGCDRLATDDILAELARLDHRPWPDFAKGAPINAHRLARLLRRFGIQSQTLRFKGGAFQKGFKKCDFSDAFDRYL